jgi:hypothetical protein
LGRSWRFLAVGLFSACAAPPVAFPSRALPIEQVSKAEPAELSAYTIPPLPDWTNSYPGSEPNADIRYFRIKKLMTDYSLDRLQAVEVQSQYRHLTAKGVPFPSAFAEAIARVRAGQLGSGIELAKLRSAPFIVVYDLDETLYQAFYKSGDRGPDWRSFVFESGNRPGYVELRPGWQEAIARIRALGGMVILFTARSDDVMKNMVAAWRLSGRGILQSVDGFLTKSYLVLQEKMDGDPIALPSKDLRIFDEKLERVIIVDDNPKRVVQHHRQRLIKKFQADPYLQDKNSGKGGSEVIASFERTLPAVVAEIEEAVGYMRAPAHGGVTFAQAYLPYTLLGQVAMEALRQGGLREEAARQYIRDHPSYVDSSF